MILFSLSRSLIYAALLSGVLVSANRHSVGAGGAAAATLLVCVAIAVVQFTAFGPIQSKRQAVQLWLLFVLMPGAVVFAASRLPLFRSRPWWLFLNGSISFVFAIVVAMIAYNILFVGTLADVAMLSNRDQLS